MKKFVKSELTLDMREFIDGVCRSLKGQRASATDYREAARDIAHRFLPTTSTKSAFTKMEKEILDYMVSHNYITKDVLKAGFTDNNGISVIDPDEVLPKELASRRYGCRLQFSNDSSANEEVLELMLDQGFVKVSAYKLREYGVLYRDKSVFFAHSDSHCNEIANDITEDYTGFRVSRTINVVWSQYYDITIVTDEKEQKLKYHQLT